MADGGLIDEIFVALGFKVDDKQLKNVDKSVKTTLDSVKRLALGVTGAIVALDRMANSLAKNNQEFINFNRQTGISVDNLNRIAGAAMMSDYNFSPETAMQSMQALQSNLAQIKLGQGNIAPFQMLGISPVGKDATQVIEDLRQAIVGIDDMTAVNLIQQMGLSPEFISLLRMTREEMNEFSAQAGQYMLSEEQRQQMHKYQMELRLVYMEFAYLGEKIMLKVMPPLTHLLEGFTTLLEAAWEFRGLLAFLGIGGVVAIMRMNTAVKILGITINSAFGKWLVALTAIYFLLEDLAYWKMGKGSLIGDLYEWGERGFSKDKDAKTTDSLHKEVFGKDRNAFQKYADWMLNGGVLGTLTGGAGRQHDMLQKLQEYQENQQKRQRDVQDKLSANNSGLGQVNSSQNIEQNNYMNFGQASPERIAQTTTDLMFAYVQADGVV